MRDPIRPSARPTLGAAAPVAAALAAALIVAACGGATTTTQPTTASTAAPAATTASTELVADIDVGGGRTQHLVCLGPTDLDEPTILLEAGLGAPYQSWADILGPLSETHRVCAYDRAGLGDSPASPGTVRTTADVLIDAHSMLAAANVYGPFVLVGHSFGAWPVALYAATYPTEVLGVVLVDPRGPSVSDAWAAALPPATSGEPEAVTLNRDELATFEHDPSLNDEHMDLAASSAQVIAALDKPGPLFASRPVVVLRASETPTGWADLPADLAAVFDDAWFAGQQAFADESESGEVVTVEGAGHEIHAEQPDVVISAIEAMLASVTGS